MDGSSFDHLTKSLVQFRSRRGLSRLLGGLAMGVPLVVLGVNDGAAKKKKNKKKKDKDRCKPNCGGGTLCCGGSCVDVIADRNNCGACGNICNLGRICQGGSCVRGCLGPECGNECVDLQRDPNHCGRCGNVCPSGDYCGGGSCRASWQNLTTFGSSGSGASQFDAPHRVAVVPGGKTVWVADYENDRISVWTENDGIWTNVTTFGSEGSGPDQLSRPADVAVAPDGQTAWVAESDPDKSWISVWTKSAGIWTNLTTFGGYGTDPTQFYYPSGVAVASDGKTLLVADSNNYRISVWKEAAGIWTHQTTFGSRGSGSDQFSGTADVAVSADGKTAWVADAGNYRISVWSENDGTWVNQTTFGGKGYLDGPVGVAASADGETVWVTDAYRHRISIWADVGGTWTNLTTFGSEGSGPDQLNAPQGVAVAEDEQTVWVADWFNDRISVWRAGSPTT